MLRRAPVPALLASFAATGAMAVPAAAATDGRIFFESNRSGNFEIYSMLPDGSGLTSPIMSPADEGAPAVSPDGTMLAFHSTFFGSADIWVAGVDGSAPRRVTADPGNETSPAWSADGRRLAYDDEGAEQIFTVALDGSDKRQITKGAPNSNPAFSPDGLHLSYQQLVRRGTPSENLDVIVSDAGGGNPVNVTNSEPAERDTDWSADGTRLAFARDGYGTFAVKPDGTAERQITTGKFDAEPSFAPSGAVAFQSRPPTMSGEISPDEPPTFLATTARAQLTIGPYDARPDWAPALPTTPGGASGPSGPAGGPGASQSPGGQPGSTASTPATPASPVRLTELRLGPSKFRPRPLRRRRGGTTVVFGLSSPALVRFTVRRSCTGCKRLEGTIRRRGEAGRNSFAFSGRLADHALRPGLYRLVATVGGRDRAVTFRIRR